MWNPIGNEVRISGCFQFPSKGFCFKLEEGQLCWTLTSLCLNIRTSLIVGGHCVSCVVQRQSRLDGTPELWARLCWFGEEDSVGEAEDKGLQKLLAVFWCAHRDAWVCTCVCLCVCGHHKQARQIPSSWTVQWKVSLKMQYIIFHEFNRVFMILQSASTRHSWLEAAQQET